jgi:hypothetical protein
VSKGSDAPKSNAKYVGINGYKKINAKNIFFLKYRDIKNTKTADTAARQYSGYFAVQNKKAVLIMAPASMNKAFLLTAISI